MKFWPWKGEDYSAASFEKTVSALSSKITAANVKRDGLKTRSRRFKALWTLYTSFAYILYTLILALVTGHNNWGPVEYAAVAGGPVIIYAVRYAISAIYDFRISSAQAYVESLSKQKEEAIEKFKEATKYNTTQKLLEKYDAAPKAQTPSRANGESRKDPANNGSPQLPQPRRTNMPPPPTANIRRPGNQETPPTPQTPLQIQQRGDIQQKSLLADQQTFQGSPMRHVDHGADFAPNAFPSSPQYSDSGPYQPKWYDRIMDVLLGEDETRPINRIALICQHCKLVNGQAPPGTKSLEEIGRWRCLSCQRWNGEATEVQNIIDDVVKGQPPLESPSTEITERPDSVETDDAEAAPRLESSEEDISEPPAKSTRSQAKVS